MTEAAKSLRAIKPYYEDELVTLYNGRCEDVLPSLGTFDLIFTSPPYNKGLRIDGRWEGRTTATCKGSRSREGYGQHDDMMPMPEYEAWQRSVVAECWEHLTERGALFYNHKPRVLNGQLWTPLACVGGVPLRQIIIWHTGAGVNINPRAWAPAHEWVMVMARSGWKIDASTSAKGDVWQIGTVRGTHWDGNDHPAPFPIALPERAIVASSPASVLDPFAGSGTTLVAAKRLGVKAIGVELETRYCEMAANRLAQGSLFGVV